MWVRIHRRRRIHRWGAVALLAAAAGTAALVGRPGAGDARGPVLIHAELEGAPRGDGSAPLSARWRVSFEGAELRVYRNALGLVRRCPGSPGCTATARGGELSLPLDTAGEYRALVFSRRTAAGGRTLEEDVVAARARGTQVEISPSLVAY